MRVLTAADFPIALAFWIASLIGAVFLPQCFLLVIATSFNLWHQRRTLHNAGQEFSRRVQEVLAAQIASFDERLVKTENSVADIKESQMKMMGAFRGRSLP